MGGWLPRLHRLSLGKLRNRLAGFHGLSLAERLVGDGAGLSRLRALVIMRVRSRHG